METDLRVLEGDLFWVSSLSSSEVSAVLALSSESGMTSSAGAILE